MTKKLSSVFLILLLAIAFTACADTAESETNNTATTTQNIAEYGAPERNYDLQGQIKSIMGNEITVNRVISEQQELTDEEKAKRQQEMQNLSPEEKEQIRKESIEVTDETKTFIVPIGVPIISMQNTGENPEVKQMDLADIQKGSLLKIWFKADSQEGEAEFIQLMNNGGI